MISTRKVPGVAAVWRSCILATLLAQLLCVGRAGAAVPTLAMNGHIPSEADCAAMEALGARAVRMDFNWFQLNPQKGSWNWGYLDAAVQSANDHHLAIYATVAYTPKWASSVPSCTQSSPDEAARCESKLPASTADWTRAVTEVVTRYKGKVECWGIWNEPNLKGFFDGTEDQFVTQIFNPAAAAIRAADPAAKICGPELAGLTKSSNWNGEKGTCVLGQCIRNGWERDLGELLDRVGSQIDIVTHHFYKDDANGIAGALLDGETTLGVLLHDSARHVIEAHGAGGKEFWLTETGWEHPPQGSVSEATIATRIVDLYGKQEEVCAGTFAGSAKDPWPRWTRTYYFHFPYDPGSGWGIVAKDGSPLAPYTALQAWAKGRTTSACTGLDAPPPDAAVVDGAAPDLGGGGMDGAAPDLREDDDMAWVLDGLGPDRASRDRAVAADGTAGDVEGEEPGEGCSCAVGRRARADASTALAALLLGAWLARRRYLREPGSRGRSR